MTIIFIRKTKYVIIGVDDKKFDDNDMRVLYDVDYKVPSQSDVNKWLNSASSPSIAGLECGLVPFQGVNLFVVTIPPTFNLHETTRELVTPGRTFHKYTVFMRQDENIVPASVRDGVTIQQLKQLYRQEVANPPSAWISSIACGIVAFILSGIALRLPQIETSVPEQFVPVVFIVLGVFFGAEIGWIGKVLNETRYDWRYMTWKQRLILMIIVLFSLAVFYLLNALLNP
jgi:hypothetical protein